MEAPRPTVRVLAVLELLQTHGRMSGRELAARLEIDGRTLRRYIVVLEELGIPIYTERGRHGGYVLMPGFKLPPLIFNNDEALALTVGLVAARQLGLSNAAMAVESAQAKLERVMPEALRQRAAATHGAVALDLPYASVSSNNAALMELSDAIRDCRTAWLRYASASEHFSERSVDPYSVAYQGGRWYAIGHCHLRGAIRSFRLDRIAEVRLLDNHFQRPAGFDPIRHLQLSVATLPRAYEVEVLLKTDLASARTHVEGWLGVMMPVEHGVLLRAQTDDLDWFARHLAGVTVEFEILRPADLRAALANHAQRLLALCHTPQPAQDT